MNNSRHRTLLAFGRWLAAFGLRAATKWNDVGGYLLDYNPTYGGYVVRQIINSSGAVTEPLGSMRRTPTVMAETLDFATLSQQECQSEALPF